MNDYMPTFLSFFKRINQKRSRVIAFVLVLCGAISIAAIVTMQQCDVYSGHFKVPSVITGKVITLKLMQESDFVDYHNMFSATVRRDLEFPAIIDLGYSIRYLRSEMKRVARGEMLMYVIIDNNDKKLIGSVEVRELNDEDPGQLGIWINENYWGGGRAKEALQLITDIYFKVHPEHTSYIAHVRLWNKRSYGLLKKFGFHEEGYFYEDGEPARHILRYSRQQ